MKRISIAFSLFFLKLISFLPNSLNLFIGSQFGKLLLLLGFRKKVVSANINYCFPNFSPSQKHRLQVQHYSQLGSDLFQSILTWVRPRSIYSKDILIEGLENYEAAKVSSKPILFIGYHSTCLEEALAALSLHIDFHFFYRPNSSVQIENFIQTGREALYPCIPRLANIPGGNLNRLKEHLANGENLLLLPDQDFGHIGTEFSSFFSKPMATLTSPITLAQAANAIVLPVQYFKTQNTIQLSIMTQLNFSTDIDENCRLLNASLEKAIEKAPEQYYWVHRRFKTLPEGMESIYK